MASPFSIFRKHQKVMIAVLGVLAMFAFVFLPIILERMGLGGPVKNPVVVKTTKYGNLTAREIEGLRQRHWDAIHFLEQVQRLGVADDTDDLTGNVAAWRRRQIGDASRDNLVDIWLRAKHAEGLGVVISKKAINGFIKEVTENSENKGVSTFQLKQILKDIGITPVQLFDILRHEMLALRARELFMVSLGGTTPAQRWDYFTRLKRKATIEVVPVRVDDYIAKVEEEPSKETLRAFFEEHRDAYAFPRSPEPGFRVPHRIAVNYLKVDYEKFGSPDLVTDEEVRAENEKNKEVWDALRRYSATESTDDSTETGDTPTGTDDTPTQTDNTPTEKQPAAESNDEPVTESTDAATEPEDTTEDAASEEASDTSGDMSATSPNSPFKLVSLLQEEEEVGEQDATDENTSSDTPIESTKPPAAEDAAAEDAAPGNETEEPAVVGPKLPTFDSPPEPADEQPEEKPADDDIVSTSTGMAIRRQLADQRAQAVMGEMSDLQDRIMSYFSKRNIHKTNNISGDGEQVDLAALDAAFAKEIRAAGEESGLIWGVAPNPDAGIGPMMSNFESQDFEIGRTGILADRRFIPFVQYAFEANRQLYGATISMEFSSGNRYLFWKVADSKERIPKFEGKGVEDEVRRVWKVQKARQLATEHAETLAEKARKDSLRSLSDSIGSELGVVVSKTDPFSWLTRGSAPAGTRQMPPAQPTDLEPIVEMAGPDFMRTVFGLSRGGVAVVMNQPRKIAYVVRVSEVNPPEAVLRAQFKVDPYHTYYDIDEQEQRATLRAWRESLRTEVGLEWVEQPEQEPTE